MKKIFGILAVLTMVMFLATPAMATWGGGGSTTNNTYNTTNNNDNSVTNQGGQGGAGGNACAVGVGIGKGGKGGNATIERGAIDISNKNTNNNINTIGNATSVFGDANSGNIQDQGQHQGQDQSQGQSQSNYNDVKSKSDSSADADADASALSTSKAETTINEGDFTQTFEAAEMKRGFAMGVEMTFPNLGSHYGPDSGDGTVLPLPNIISLKPVWNRATLKANVKNADMRMRSRSFVNRLKGRAAKGEPTDTMELNIGLPAPTATLIGIITVEADDIYTTNLELVSKAALDALTMEGADAMYIVVDGASRVTKASGWGIGFNQTVAAVEGGSGQNIAGVSSGGTGYSSGKAGYRQVPWVQVFVVDYPEAK